MLCSFEGLWTRVPPLRSRAALRAGLEQFPVALAWGKHLFPFRTEQLSPTAPMVLGLHGPGRVGRRRFFTLEPPPGRLVAVNARRRARPPPRGRAPRPAATKVASMVHTPIAATLVPP